MLHNRDFGYAVMNKKLTRMCSYMDVDIETCKRYCRNGDIIVEKIPYVCGFSITFRWEKFYKPLCYMNSVCNILWLHLQIVKEYNHKIGKIVYTS